MKALLVDDSSAMRAILAAIVSELGFEVEEAEHGLEAIEYLELNDLPDVVLIDWNMPRMNGLELVEHIRAQAEYDGVRLVMVTSETEMDRIASALDAGADECLMKPFHAADLISKFQLIGLEAA